MPMVYSKRTFCYDKEVTIEPKNGIPVSCDIMPQCFSGTLEPNENVLESFHNIHIGIAEDEQTDPVCYMPICREWKKDHCSLLGRSWGGGGGGGGGGGNS